MKSIETFEQSIKIDKQSKAKILINIQVSRMIERMKESIKFFLKFFYLNQFFKKKLFLEAFFSKKFHIYFSIFSPAIELFSLKKKKKRFSDSRYLSNESKNRTTLMCSILFALFLFKFFWLTQRQNVLKRDGTFSFHWNFFRPNRWIFLMSFRFYPIWRMSWSWCVFGDAFHHIFIYL